MKKGYVYIMSDGGLQHFYIGVTSTLLPRVEQHRSGHLAGYTQRFSLKQLVYWEEWPSIEQAIHREKQLKNWHHAWKKRLVLEANPTGRDLYFDLLP